MGAQQHVALAKIDAGGADVLSGGGGFLEDDMLAVAFGVFLDHDGIGAVRHHAAGENPQSLAGLQRPRERPSRGDLADHMQPRRNRRDIGGAHRIAVHRRHRDRWLGAARGKVACQHPAMGVVKTDHFFRQRFDSGKNSR